MLIDAAVERRDQYKQAWRELGGKVGISEWDYKTHKPSSNATTTAQAVPQNIASDSIPSASATANQQGTLETPTPRTDFPQSSSAETIIPPTTARSQDPVSRTRNDTVGSQLSSVSDSTLHEMNGLDEPNAVDGQLKTAFQAVTLGPAEPVVR